MTKKDSFHFGVFLDKLSPLIKKSFYFLGSFLIGWLSLVLSFEFGVPNLNQLFILLLLLFNLIIPVDINFFLGELNVCEASRHRLRCSV